MKKILSLAVLLAFSLAMYAQKDVTKFLGIPVDGTKSEMIKKLKEKGFTESSFNKEILEGEFNGMNVFIGVGTNNNKVYRIYIADANTIMDEADIRIRFNTLCQQFTNNEKYVPLPSSDYLIPDDEDISYEMNVNNKRYEAHFYQRPDSASSFQSIVQREISKYTDEQLESLTKEQTEKIIEKLSSYAIDIMSKKCVWFMINRRLGGYFIGMYYDNKYNQAQGEDL